MKDKSIFFDTNLIIYLYSIDEQSKRDVILSLIENHSGSLSISIQVINEVCNVLTKKFKFSAVEVKDVVNELNGCFAIFETTLNTTTMALNVLERYRYSFWDSMILASALEGEVKLLYSEDMQHGQVIDDKFRIVNPFI